MSPEGTSRNWMGLSYAVFIKFRQILQHMLMKQGGNAHIREVHERITSLLK
jgi:hypothetical protein